MSQSIQSIPFNKINGQSTSLNEYAGSVVLIVNVASKCGLTPQYEELVKIYNQYKEKGLVILGFPANNFAEQEPGSNAEIETFCSATYGVDFPMAEKISVNGDNRHPLYQSLIQEKLHPLRNPNSELEKKLDELGFAPKNDTDITWNFEKFLVSREGKVIGRFAPDIAPADARIIQAIQAAL
ncbi:MAG: Thioredoxin/glutathione peroxidase BtuE [Candidatus Celerinatantimonas neptuna]|nr:MAG: Thioredoxin/glutathione peroxidase BtuE [Candidatus Celerinatantimonas neptuna]